MTCYVVVRVLGEYAMVDGVFLYEKAARECKERCERDAGLCGEHVPPVWSVHVADLDHRDPED